MYFEIVSEISDSETIAQGRGVRAELHWYEASGVGKFEFKIKRLI